MKRGTLLVVGGAGYIGSHCTALLLDHGYTALVLDNLTTGHRQAVPEGASLITGDLGDVALLNEFFQRHEITAVFHFAARSIVAESARHPLAYFENNVAKTTALLHAMAHHEVPIFIFSSTAAVYGEPTADLLTEDHPTKPLNPYGRSKWMVEVMLSDAAEAGTLRFASLRYFNAAGADLSGLRGEDHRPETHLAPRILLGTLAHDGVAIHPAANVPPWGEIYGTDYDTPDGTCIRDFIHVTDLAEAHVLALRHLQEGGENLICNLGTETGFSVRQVIEAAARVTGVTLPVREKPRRLGDPARLVASASLSRRVLGWNPRFSDLETILHTAWEWHRTHPQGYSYP
ncbi:MAG: UDP-glucose 4-epimerase GalE [Dehalococcoidia bacterium]